MVPTTPSPTTPEAPVTVRLRSRLVLAFTVAGAAMGGLVAMAIGPTAAWLMTRLDSPPTLVEMMDQVRLIWSVPVLMVLGAVIGLWVSSARDRRVGRLTIDSQTVTVDRPEGPAAFQHRDITEVFLDDADLVLLGRAGHELARTPAEDGLASELKEAFTMFGLPWSGTTDPRDVEFHPWVDRSQELDAEMHAMLRDRRRALETGDAAQAEVLRDQLAAHGVMVRDRAGGQQQIRILPG
ncbi:YqeB family protein [Nesterenkonia sp. K-15-9-6]|uniref:YqeB family protein n=1 Tax=Nesterenkonia sp. K-15-9-6 TaxID=3093918 RepID=UPI004043A87F